MLIFFLSFFFFSPKVMFASKTSFAPAQIFVVQLMLTAAALKGTIITHEAGHPKLPSLKIDEVTKRFVIND